MKKWVIVIILILLLCPTTTFSKSKKSNGSKSYTCKDISGNLDNQCEKDAGVSIRGGKYTRLTPDGHTNIVGKREIIIEPNDKSIEYEAFIIKAEDGDIKIDEEVNRSNIMRKLGGLVKNVSFSGNYSFDLNAGETAIVLVVLKKDTETKTCCNKDEHSCDGKGKKCELKCKDQLSCREGDFKLSRGDPGTAPIITIEGTAAWYYASNPEDSGMVSNEVKGSDACKNAFDGTNTNDDKYSGKNNADYQQYYNRFLYNACNDPSVPFNLTVNAIQRITNKLTRVTYLLNDLQKNSITLKQVNDKIDSYSKKISKTYCGRDDGKCPTNIFKDDLTDISNIGLMCNEKDVNDLQEEYLYYTKEEAVKTVALSDHSTPTVCKKKCYEYLTVTYSPPQTVKAGLCFQEKVTVKSISECGVDFSMAKDAINSIPVKNMCAPVPICENDENKTQAGPSDDFDDCVNSCDGGKYTQSCINKCYKKVYETKTTKKKTSSSKQMNVEEDEEFTTTNDLVYQGSKTTATTMSKKACENGNRKNCLSTDCDGDGSDDDDPDCLKYYYKSTKVVSDCETEDIIKYVHNGDDSSLTKCAEYYMRAKLLRPMGNYEWRDGKTDSDWGPLTWNKDKEITTAGETTRSTPNIPMSVGRASPFYFRNKAASKALLTSLVVPTSAIQNSNPYWRKYNIRDDGIKRQFSERYQCPETCHYTGCDKNDALNSKQYAGNIGDDLEKIGDALENCTSADSCKKTTKTTDFNINITTRTYKNDDASNKKASPSKNGQTTLHSTFPSGDIGMFVPAFKDDSSTNGILGKCYDDETKTPHYQTTITFPGTWINLKTGEVEYDEQKTDIYRSKPQYYCTPYNANTVNEEWWDWAIKDKYKGDAPSRDTIEYNIEANLGKNDAGTSSFGKYNWGINFRCFYALKNNIKITEGEPVYRGDEGTEEDMGVDESIDRNYDIRVVTLESIFPNNRLRGYNWGRRATLSSKDEKIQTALNTSGYGVDPVDYSHKIIGKVGGKGEAGTYNNSDNYELRVTLDSDDVNNLKNEPLEFTGTFNNNSKTKDIPGLYYYLMNTAWKNQYGIKTTWTPGINSKTAIEAIKK